MTQAAITALLWSEDETENTETDFSSVLVSVPRNQYGGTQTTGHNAQIHAKSLAMLEADCKAFIEATKADIFDAEQVGHDFIMTRNGHGVGFWDRPEIYGEQADFLTEKAHKFGTVCAFWADDKTRIYIERC